MRTLLNDEHAESWLIINGCSNPDPENIAVWTKGVKEESSGADREGKKLGRRATVELEHMRDQEGHSGWMAALTASLKIMTESGEVSFEATARHSKFTKGSSSEAMWALLNAAREAICLTGRLFSPSLAGELGLDASSLPLEGRF